MLCRRLPTSLVQFPKRTSLTALQTAGTYRSFATTQSNCSRSGHRRKRERAGVIGRTTESGAMENAHAAAALDDREMKEWQEICAAEDRAPKPKKGVKPSPDEIKSIQSLRARKKEFLARLSEEKRQGLIESKGKKNGAATSKSVKDPAALKALQASRIRALSDWAIRDPSSGEICQLVDIGINVQSRFSGPMILAMFERAAAAGVSRVVLTGCCEKTSRQGLQLCRAWHGPHDEATDESTGKYPRGGAEVVKLSTFATVGIHPHDAKTLASKEKVIPEALAALRDLASDPFCVSLGECGLDYDRMFSPMESQKLAFQAQVALAVDLGRPLFVHLRERGPDKGEPLGALEHAVAIFDQFPGLVPENVCIHCFTDNLEALSALVAKGFCVGFTGYAGIAKRASASGTLEALAAAKLPINRLMIETDAPFMRPDKKWFPDPDSTGLRKAKNNEPSAMPAVCRAVADAFVSETGDRLAPHEIANQTTKNAVTFFKLEEAQERIRQL